MMKFFRASKFRQEYSLLEQGIKACDKVILGVFFDESGD